MKLRFTGWLLFALTALAVSVLCLLRLFTASAWVGLIGVTAALSVGYFRHADKKLRQTAAEAARQLEQDEKKED